MYYYKTVIKKKQLDYIDALFEDSNFNLDNIAVDKFIRTVTYQNETEDTFETLEFFDKSLIEQAIEKMKTIIGICEKFTSRYNPEDMYYEFKIPKRTGGYRTIDAPDADLKEIQYAVLKELKRMKVLHHDSAWAYVKGRDVVNALKEHQANKSRWFLKLDVKDFFGSCTKDVLYKQFRLLYPFCFVPEDMYNRFIDALFSVSGKDGKLPQGTPLSPYLTNLIMVPIDYLINRLLYVLSKNEGIKKQRYVYTRYADDILISAKESFNHELVVEDIKRLLDEQVPELHIKDEKTRYGSSNGRNWNLGIMYNKDRELTIGSKKKKYIKQSIHNYIVSPTEFDVSDAQVLLGQLSWLRNVEPDYFAGLMKYYEDKVQINVWEHLLNIIRNE